MINVMFEKRRFAVIKKGRWFVGLIAFEMGRKDMRRNPFDLGAVILVLTLSLFLLLVSIAGCSGSQEEESKDVEDIWTKAEAADKSITSMHMEIAIYYENTQYGSGQIQSMIIDMNGEDVHEQDLLLGQVYAEFIRVDGKQYSKDMMSEEWAEVPASGVDNAAAEYSSRFLELPSLADSQEYVATEVIDDREAEHYRFTLSPLRVVNMFVSQVSSDFSESTGAVVDVWIDKEDHYLLKYELVVYNAKITDEIGYGDIKFVVNIRNINEPVEIAAPI